MKCVKLAADQSRTLDSKNIVSVTMSEDSLENIVSKLRCMEKFSSLVNKYNECPTSSFMFEILFAHTFENYGMSLEYEVGISPLNNSTVDFTFTETDNKKLCFELVSPEMSDELKRQCTPRKTEVDGILEWEVLLESGHSNEYLRPESQTIRIQEKILEKVNKFPDPTDDIYSIIVVDCSSFHFGHFDGEDCRMVMFGNTQNPLFQEYWEGSPVKGILNPENNNRGAKDFRNRITSVLFIQEKSTDIFSKAFVVLNIHRSKQHLESFWQRLRKYLIYQKLKYVPYVSN